MCRSGCGPGFGERLAKRSAAEGPGWVAAVRDCGPAGDRSVGGSGSWCQSAVASVPWKLCEQTRRPCCGSGYAAPVKAGFCETNAQGKESQEQTLKKEFLRNKLDRSPCEEQEGQTALCRWCSFRDLRFPSAQAPVPSCRMFRCRLSRIAAVVGCLRMSDSAFRPASTAWPGS